MPVLQTKSRRVTPSHWILAVAAAGVALSMNGALADASEKVFLVAGGAKNVREHHFDNSYWQVSYTIDLDFPWLAVDEPQEKQLQQAGWLKCETTGWQSYIDASETPHSIIHQHKSDWKKGNRMITVALRYVSSMRGDTRDALPDNTTQSVFLIFDEDVKGHDTLRLFDIDCP